MTNIKVTLRNGEYVWVGPCSLELNSSSIRGLSESEIGSIVVGLMATVDELQAYELEFGQDDSSFDSVEGFHAHVAKLREHRSSLVQHTRSNKLWQIDYQQYGLSDFQALLSADDEQSFLRPKLREAVEILISNPGTWREIASALGISVSTTQERIREALRTYYGWHPTLPRA